jgi:hypothetical protein
MDTSSIYNIFEFGFVIQISFDLFGKLARIYTHFQEIYAETAFHAYSTATDTMDNYLAPYLDCAYDQDVVAYHHDQILDQHAHVLVRPQLETVPLSCVDCVLLTTFPVYSYKVAVA